MALVRWALIVLTALAAGFSWWSYARADGQSERVARYYCPMHPEVTSPDPGECPICHMTLEPIPKERQAGAAGPSAAPHASHAPSAAPHPSHAPSAAPHASHAPTASPPPTPGSPPPGLVPVELALDRLQSIGVRTAVAVETPTRGAVRIAATVEAPEGGVAEVHVRAPGFVEHVAVRETGVRVRRGQALLSVYSPEIYQAQSELIAVKDWPVVGGGQSAADRSRKKLELLGMSKSAIDQLLKKGEPSRRIGVGAPISGHVSKKNVVLGSYVTPETALYEIVDLSKVYIVANVYQRDLPAARVGADGTFTTPGSPPAVAKVDLVYPNVDREARTTRVRLQVKNPDLLLLPGQYGWVEFQQLSRTVVAVPRDALVDTGLHRYVFVEEKPGRFSPREVELGAELGTDRIEITGGLSPNERVVSGATFLIDSESRLQASLQGKAAPIGEDHSQHGAP